MGMDAGVRPLTAEPVSLETALEEASHGFARRRPAFSAQRTLTVLQWCILIAALGLIGFASANAPWTTLNIILWSAFVFFTVVIGFRLATAAATLSPAAAATGRWAGELPVYTLLCPLYLEADVVADLVAAIRRLHYPADKLDVKLILEEDDVETIAVVRSMRLGAPFDVLITPDSEPRTKPKALNYALAFARGSFVAVYDAEDAPHPSQLKAALDAFAAGGPGLACVQAPLRIHNAGQRWIAEQFAAEYAVQFGAMLPFLARFGLPLPLGGTSNHFRRTALEASGGWDPFNVTEDADLGYRLARDGYTSGVIAPATLEEAPVSLSAWRKQRTRWIKGHLQTWLVLMRNPWRTAREMGVWAFASMQVVLFGGVVAAFAHGPIAALIVADVVFGLRLFGDVGLALAISGYAAALYMAIAAAAMMRDWRVARAAMTMPLYWPLATIAAGHALWELIVRPHHWAKTEHGFAKPGAIADLNAV